MVEIFKEFQETCVEKITQTHGEGLEETAYITDPEQIEIVLEGFIYSEAGLNSRYVPQRNEKFLRLSKSFGGKTCNDIVEIAKAPRFQQAGPGFFSGGDD